MTSGLKAAIHKTKYTIDKRQGLTCILGDVGMGKSSVLRLLYADYLERDDARAAFIPTPVFNSEFAFLKRVCGDFDIPPQRSLQNQEQELQRFLLEQYKEKHNVVVFLDEAQMLKPKMLEQVRTMLNFETNKSKLIQIVLAGQLELKNRLLDPHQRALRSRIFVHSLLDPLSPGETKQMIAHRCDIAEIPIPFSEPVLEQIYELTGGVPREVLKLCAISFELAQMNGLAQVPSELIAEAQKQVVLQ
jgi:general secretion pathway protein A